MYTRTSWIISAYQQFRLSVRQETHWYLVGITLFIVVVLYAMLVVRIACIPLMTIVCHRSHETSHDLRLAFISLQLKTCHFVKLRSCLGEEECACILVSPVIARTDCFAAY
jgi:hypothetical protein